MNCNQMKELFSEYAVGSLPRSLSDAAREHFVECPECQKAYGYFSTTLRSLDTVCDIKPPSNLHSLIMNKVEESLHPKTESFWKRFEIPFRLSSRAFATSFALLAVFGLINGFFPVRPALSSLLQTTAHANNAATPALVASLRPNSYDSESGLAMRFSSNRNSVFSVNLRSVTSESTQYRVVYLTGGQSKFGTIGKGQSSVINIASIDGVTTVARVDWSCKGRVYSHSIFVPGKMDGLGSGKRIKLNIGSGNAADTLKSIASAYGVAIVASGDVTAMVPGADINHGTPDEALYNTVARAGYTWRQLDSSVYLVETPV